ncbi:M24 family metallopeptidase [Aidingimonas halophila]|uniref:Xaa-Pro aminopeptidase n=1 Tax=Aidingimonas halophila TaxID=574349 RepID=A0A1H3D4U0_9GAMM|nr:Xaa-Pro peptidase family protein [Aidingimonas halophila]GHC30615.1 Xaa-Pro aminopeptidase [Aidingimonas halophila]SDX60679.1 Xaa-Pro aminopeptidase [Aidingimonas halophila]
MNHDAYRHALSRTLAGSECPFPASEFQRRRAAVGAAMREQSLDGLLLTDPSDIFYLTGYTTFEVSVHTALVFTPERLVLQVPSIETGPAVACTQVDDILGYRWEGLEEVLGPLADALAAAGRRIGIDSWHGSLRYGVIQGLMDRLPTHRFEDAGEVMAGARIVKTASELDCLAESARITAVGIESAAAAIRPGVTDSEIAAIGARALHGSGSEFMSMQPIVTAGQRSSIIHTNHQRHRIAEGEPVFLEFGAAFKRYTAPMMRTVVAGEPTDEMHSVFATIRAMYDTLLDAMRPAHRFDDAARAAERVMAPIADDVFFSGVHGYAVGAQFPPSWVEGSGFIARGQMRCFESGMVFHLPLCLRLPGRWGIGCSDTVRVTENGGVPITNNAWTLTGSGGL